MKLRAESCVLSLIKGQLLHNEDNISQDHLHFDGSKSSSKTGNNTSLADQLR